SRRRQTRRAWSRPGTHRPRRLRGSAGSTRGSTLRAEAGAGAVAGRITSVGTTTREGVPMAAANDRKAAIIEEVRANEGKVGGTFAAAQLLLLHHTGARSGTERVSPLAYQPVGDAYAVFASKGGAPTNPDWYHNLVAHPDTTIEVGSASLPVRARVA